VPVSRKAVAARARHVRLLVFDVDGVMTDGTVSITANGDEAKTFSIRDGANPARLVSMTYVPVGIAAKLYAPLSSE